MASLLTEETLDGFRERAPQYDRENTFFQEDFDELKAAGYLKLSVPKEFGGEGADIAETARETRRLAAYAPADAVAVNMHLYWAGLASDLHHVGDASLDWLLEDRRQRRHLRRWPRGARQRCRGPAFHHQRRAR